MVTAYAIGFVALALGQWVLARDTDHRFHDWMACSVGLWALHYFLMGTHVGAAMHLLAVCNLLIAGRMQSAALGSRVLIAVLFAGAALGAGIKLYSGPWDILMIAGQTLFFVAQTLFTGIVMRAGFIVASGMFFAFALHLGSVPATLVQVISAVSAGIGIWRRLEVRRPRLIDDAK